MDPIGLLAAAISKNGEDGFAKISIMRLGCLSNPEMERWCFLQTGGTCPEANNYIVNGTLAFLQAFAS
jgi:hypothetical protein